MATTRALTNIFRAIGAADLESARSAALELCSLEDKQGHRSAARQLRGALNGTTGSVPVTVNAAPFMSAALLKVESPLPLIDMSLTAAQRQTLTAIAGE